MERRQVVAWTGAVLVGTLAAISELQAGAPDGKSIAYVGGASFAGGGTAIQVVDVATGSSRVALTVKSPGIPAGGRFVRLAWMHTRQ